MLPGISAVLRKKRIWPLFGLLLRGITVFETEDA